MKKKVKIFSVTIGAIILLPIVLYLILGLAALFFPDKAYQVHKNYKTLSSDVLIRKMSQFNILWRETAMEVLAERKEQKAVPYLIKLVNSPMPDTRQEAMRALGKIGDGRAIEPLMKIVEKGWGTNAEFYKLDYYGAISALVEMRHEGAFPYLVKWAEREDGYRNGSIRMLKEYGKVEGIVTLKDIQRKLKDMQGDNWNVESAKKEIVEAIKHLKGE